MKNSLQLFSLFLFSFLLFTACSDDNKIEPVSKIDSPVTYDFSRNGQSTVSFSGQTTRIQMAEELIAAAKDFSKTEANLLEIYANQTIDGQDTNPFSQADLNESSKSIRSKTAASIDYFATNTVEGMAIKNQIGEWLAAQVKEVFPNANVLAKPGIAGQIADGSSTRYVNAQGVEYDQIAGKSLVGALMTDQILNNYLSPAVLDAGENATNQAAEVLEDGKNYTTMEHKWDEAYGYVYGTAANAAEPNLTIGADDNFLNKYIGKVEADSDFAGIADDIYQAFKTGRAAIVAENYEARDAQAAIIQEKISTVIAVRAVFYLQQGKIALEKSPADFGAAFHDLSEGLGFIYSLQFTRVPNTNLPYFTKAEVDGFLNDLLTEGANGLWDVSPSNLDNLSNLIAEKFGFSVEQAGSAI